MVAILSLSGNELSHDCAEVVHHMRMLGINGDVTCNRTMLDGQLEHGCRVVVAEKDPIPAVQSLWERMQQLYGLDCAHVRIESDVRSGCVLDVLRPSACPSATRAAIDPPRKTSSQRNE